MKDTTGFTTVEKVMNPAADEHCYIFFSYVKGKGVMYLSAAFRAHFAEEGGYFRVLVGTDGRQILARPSAAGDENAYHPQKTGTSSAGCVVRALRRAGISMPACYEGVPDEDGDMVCRYVGDRVPELYPIAEDAERARKTGFAAMMPQV